MFLVQASISLTMEIPLAAGLDLIWGHPSWPHSWLTVLMTAAGELAAQARPLHRFTDPGSCSDSLANACSTEAATYACMRAGYLQRYCWRVISLPSLLTPQAQRLS
jgi:hypothetical protein